MALDLQKLKERLQASKDGFKTKSGFLKLKNGETVLRIVPVANGDPFYEAHLHYNVGGSKSGFICPRKTSNSECPVCEFAFQLWKEQTPESIAQAKKLFPRQRFYSPVIVRGEESQGVRWWSYGHETYTCLLNLCLNPDYGDISDPENGTDLVVRYETPKGGLFPKTKIEPRRKSTKLCEGYTPEVCEKIMSSVPDISTLLEKKTVAEIKELLDEHWLEKNDDGEGTSETISEPEAKETEKFNKPKSETVVEENSVDKAFKELLGEE